MKARPASAAISPPSAKPSNVELREAEFVEAIAERVVDLLVARGVAPARSGMLTAGELADELGVARSFVYEHADELGAVRLGGGSKPRLRFDLGAARSALSCLAGKRSEAPNASVGGDSQQPSPPRARRLPSRVPKPGAVLAVRGRREAA